MNQRLLRSMNVAGADQHFEAIAPELFRFRGGGYWSAAAPRAQGGRADVSPALSAAWWVQRGEVDAPWSFGP